TDYKEYGKYLDDMDIDEKDDELMSNPKVKKRPLDIGARYILIKIAMIQLESGYPYLMFKSNANNQHPLKDIRTVKMSN
ncbi:ribonucleotide-diphosphate reductase subunit alpha, partial [Bacillus thuringiensis]|nr:ribonucleotide-diphosphate reductase subunit alpha [Bacillus thuringiensis]